MLIQRLGARLTRSYSLSKRTETKGSLFLTFLRNSTAATVQANTPSNHSDTPSPVYHGPLTSTLRRLKIFSLSSLALSTTLTPFMFIIESSLPLSARFVLAGTAITTSGMSTALVAWCASPYVATLRRLSSHQDGSSNGLEMTTFTLGLRELVTRVYDTTFLVESKRPFAKWEFAETIPAFVRAGPLGQEETVAETLDAAGVVKGRWVVSWNINGQGTCREVGKVVRHFNVHDELLR